MPVGLDQHQLWRHAGRSLDQPWRAGRRAQSEIVGRLRRTTAEQSRGTLQRHDLSAVSLRHAGAIWYQGESNAGRAYEYRTLFPTMIKDWRAQWGEGDFPFLLVQLAPFMKIDFEPKDCAWAELRDAQLSATQSLPSVGMAVITDVGEEHGHSSEVEGARSAGGWLWRHALPTARRFPIRAPEYYQQQIEKGASRPQRSSTLTAGWFPQGGGELYGFTIAGRIRNS